MDNTGYPTRLQVLYAIADHLSAPFHHYTLFGIIRLPG
jgi:hypothetical protein